jgi:hypothetical protein
LWVAFCRVPLLKVFLQDYSCRYCVDRGSGLARTFGMRFRFVQYPAGLLFEQSFRFPTGEAFIKHVHRQTQLFAQAHGKSRGFLCHLTARAVEAEGQPDNDLANNVFAREFAQAPQVFIAIDALKGEERAGHSGFRFCDGEADAGAAVVHRQD